MLYTCVSFLLAVTLMPVCINVANRHGLYDTPDGKRKTHLGNIPYTGGFCIIFAFLTGMGLMIAFGNEPLLHGPPDLVTMFIYLAEATVIIVLLGIFDDLRDLKYTTKFIYQFFAASLIILGAIKVGLFPSVFDIADSNAIVYSLGAVISMLWFVGMTNAVNMIDGMDGLAGGSTLLSAIGLGAVALMWDNVLIASVMFVLAGTLFGFILYNRHPARVFMGDTGSMFLGFILAVFGWMLVDSGPKSIVAMFVPIAILGLPITDTLLAFFRRLVRGKNPFSADLFHIHHMMKLKFNLSVKQTVAWLQVVSFGLAGFGFLMAIVPEPIGWVLLSVLSLGMLGFLHALGYTSLIFKKPATKHVVVYKPATLTVPHPMNGDALVSVLHAKNGANARTMNGKHSSNGNGAALKNGNGHSNGNGYHPSNGHGMHATNGNGHTSPNGSKHDSHGEEQQTRESGDSSSNAS